MAAEERKRPPRIPLTQEEIAQLVALKKRNEARRLAIFKKSTTYKVFNIFNICCFFVYWELLFCFLGPCHYQTHYSKNMGVKRGDAVNTAGRHMISEVRIVGVDDKEYRLSVDDFIEPPAKYSAFQIGKDYILQKELKGMLGGSDASYRIEAASPLIFLSVFLIIISFSSFVYNLNEHPHSLRAVAILNLLTVLAFLAI
jgi:hypothetical protein